METVESESSDEAEEDRFPAGGLGSRPRKTFGVLLLPHTGEVGLRDTDAFALFCLEPPRPTFTQQMPCLFHLLPRIDYLQGLGCCPCQVYSPFRFIHSDSVFLWWGLPEHCRVLEEHSGLRPPDASSAALVVMG